VGLAVSKSTSATGFFTDTTLCIGCKACEVACKQWNDLPADGFELTGNSYDNTQTLSATTWRHVKFIEQFPVPTVRTPLPVVHGQTPPAQGRWLMMSDVCKHCVTAPCQQACPTGAIVHNEFGNVIIQDLICNGCAYCVAACPFGVITRDSLSGHAHKCTLCYDRQGNEQVPACAQACPTSSILFGPVEELRQRARKRIDELHKHGEVDAYLYGHEPVDSYSALQSFYLLVDRPSVYGLPDKPANPWLYMLGDYARALAGILTALGVLLIIILFMGA
jgi:formate dehydrogenase iron-sulfur subunit